MMNARNTSVAMAIASLLGTAAAGAANWELQPRVEVGAIYDDNYRLTDQPGEEIDVMGASLDAQLALRSEGPRSLLEILPRVRTTFFPDESAEEATDYLLGFRGETRTQRLTTGVRAQFADESVVTSDLLPADVPDLDLGEILPGDEGRVSVRTRRQLISVQPNLSFTWDERRRVIADLRYLDADFDDVFTEQVGYRDIGVGGGLQWDVSQRATLTVRGDVAQFEPDSGTEPTDRMGVDAEWRSRGSQTMEFYVRGGVIRSERGAVGLTPELTNTSFNGGVGAVWRYQVTNIFIDALRSTEPSSSGAVVDRNELRFRVNRSFSPRLSAFLALRGIQTASAVEETFGDIRDRDYVAGSTGFEWRASRQFALLGRYEYTRQKFEGVPDDGVSNGVNLSVVYEPRRID
jgi:hypothetical protein